MSRYVLRRILIMLPVVIGITFANYAIINLAPGDPVDLMIDPNVTEADRQARREALGLDDPFLVRYVRWMGELLQGNLGYSYTTYQPVTERLGERVGPTLLLMGTALVGAYVIALPLGVASAVRPYSWVDYSTGFVGLLGVSLPTFFTGLVFIYVFSLNLDWLPSGGMVSLGGAERWLDRISHLILPASVLALANLGLMLRLVRSSTLEVLRQDFVRTARAKGLAPMQVLFRHVMRNTLIPVITMAGLQIPALIAGSIITEQVFQWPGMGWLTVQAILGRDYPTLMALNLLAAVMVLAGNLVADILYGVADPRIRYE
ncbi:ABC transporter permease [Limnochorda pilosa]|uniref:Peptide ABC transporter permease n=1 Tax=Limnochorda pilosa TaxID=1555112 RepID=A0A0K2SLJ5_LIMPI|nr:ABC transporter permease [Limnochorda pilosa]BAS27996.1 peptide ABC transporter permease [Limnochorda pilosa]